LIEELKDDLPIKPALIVCSVGGGGLFCGIVEGLRKVGWEDVPVVAVETFGADSLSACHKAGRLTSLPAITSIAKSLGAKQVASKAYEYRISHPTIIHTIRDKAAVKAAIQFLQFHGYLVEPACSASLAAIYDEEETLLNSQWKQKIFVSDQEQIIVIVVCGGNVVTMDALSTWKQQFNID